MKKINKFKYVILFFLIIFVIGIVLGHIYGNRINNLNLGQSENFFNIFKNNLTVGLMLMFLGAITGGVYSIVVLGINGYIVGQVINYLIEKRITILIVSGLLPHSIFEVLGLICFSIISCLPIINIFKWLTNDCFKLDVYLLKTIAKTTINLFLIGTGLLVIAAFMEANISNVNI
ncbi:stage II sporulation protein M [Paraclostridium sordellii]|uniref:stage II sporulation protein M n=1 Tax=Paraclostridium sordellii TaxID=1505 RepID=UPI000AC9E12D|nr:stage II sporulation protein M [Paeniclostridium sordellii]